MFTRVMASEPWPEWWHDEEIILKYASEMESFWSAAFFFCSLVF